MKPSYRTLLLAAAMALAANAQAGAPTTVGEAVDRFLEAIGGRERIRAIENLVYSGGKYREGDYEGSGKAAMSVARPYFKLVGDKTNPGGYMEGYDGAAWEWFADPGVVIRTVGPPSEAIRHYAGVEHPLIDFRDKGSTARLLGETVLDERPVVAVELTRRDGFVEQFYLDVESGLIVASGGAAPIHAFGEAVQSLTRIGDYRRVAGVLIPHRFEGVRMPSGEAQSSMQWSKIEANRDLPADWFSPPDFDRTPLQAFTEHLYGQRADPSSMLWTYHEFRRAYPELDTSPAANLAGFQSLKMGSVDAALALLRQNVQDHPNDAASRFGFGRALRTAGRVDEAVAEFRRALALDPEYQRARTALDELTPDPPSSD